MKFTFIKKEDLVDKAYYIGECKYAYVATWNATSEMFEYINNSELYTSKHFSDNEEDTFLPLIKIDRPNIEVIQSGKLQIKN